MSIGYCSVSRTSVQLAENCWKCVLMCAAGDGEYDFWGALSSSSLVATNQSVTKSVSLTRHYSGARARNFRGTYSFGRHGVPNRSLVSSSSLISPQYPPGVLIYICLRRIPYHIY